MSISNSILIIDVNVIIHMEKAGLLAQLLNVKNIRIVDLVFYQEYQYKPNLCTNSVKKIKKVELNEEQVKEAQNISSDSKISFFDACIYIYARDNNCSILTGDGPLRNFGNKNSIEVLGSIWLVEQMYKNKIINIEELKMAYNYWLTDPSVFMPTEIISEKLEEIEEVPV